MSLITGKLYHHRNEIFCVCVSSAVGFITLNGRSGIVWVTPTHNGSGFLCRTPENWGQLHTHAPFLWSVGSCGVITDTHTHTHTHLHLSHCYYCCLPLILTLTRVVCETGILWSYMVDYRGFFFSIMVFTSYQNLCRIKKKLTEISDIT